MKMKVGILSLPFGPNYGCLLQSWALFKVLTNMGHNVEVLSRGWNRTDFSLLYSIKRWFYYNCLCRNLYDFYKAINRSPLIRSSAELRKYVIENDFNAIIVGSDQVWRVRNVRGADLNFFLDFLDGYSNINKISYAASFGTDQFEGTERELEIVKDLLPKFNHISVREKSGFSLCRDLFGVFADVTVDPTLLLSSNDYIEAMNLIKQDSDLVVTYILDYNQAKKTIVSRISNYYHSNSINLYQRCLGYYSVKQWLESIMNAKCVVVDSFHGMIFSIIFNKSFVVINNKKRGSSRFVSLLSQFDLEDRIVEEDIADDELKKLIKSEIDYDLVNKKKSLLIDFSIGKLVDYLNDKVSN